MAMSEPHVVASAVFGRQDLHEGNAAVQDGRQGTQVKPRQRLELILSKNPKIKIEHARCQLVARDIIV
jgi:hypothetical protein